MATNKTSDDQKPAVTENPYLTEYDQALHAITVQFRQKYPDWWFVHSARVEPIVPMKAAARNHNTRPLNAADKAKMPPKA